jgi:hypothetical protein
MIDNKYDYVLVGKNIFSLIVGLIKINNGHNVLIIDDDKVKLAGSWMYHITDLEKRFLKLMGTYYNISSLLKIDDYLTSSETLYWLNNKHIFLGDKYERNLIEFCRKLPELFPTSLYEQIKEVTKDTDIETYFSDRINNFVDQTFKYHNYQDFDQKFVQDPLNNLFEQYLKVFKDSLENWENQSSQLLARQLLFVQQIVTQTFFTDTYSEFELQTLLLSAIGPKYKINESSLIEQLSKEYLTKGGHEKVVQIEQWQLFNSNLENILLSSYEGVISFDNCLVFGNVDDRFPFQVDTQDYRTFSSIQIQVDYPDSIFEKYQGRYFSYCSSMKIGTDFPLWQARFDSDKRVIIKYLYPKRSASKPEFHFEQALKDVYTNLKRLFPSLEYEKFNLSNVITDGDDIWIEKFDSSDRFLKKIIHNTPNRKRFKLKIQATDSNLNGIDYWGPQRARPSGMFSYLMEVKNTLV